MTILAWLMVSALLASEPESLLVSEPESASALPTMVDFDSQIVPLLTHAGCNAGACHGAAAGRGGFHLSLFGSDPKSDYEAMVLFAESRRVNLVDINKSLVLSKPLGLLDHGGGEVLEEGSSSVLILRHWLQQGAKRGSQRQLRELRVEPAESIATTPNQTKILRAFATFSDGAEVDVTDWTVFRSDDPASVEILHQPTRAQSLRPGKHLIMARFWNRVVPVSLLLPYDSNQDKPQLVSRSASFVDVEIDSQLSKLNLTANTLADDETFLRRLRLDLTGRLPSPGELQGFLAETGAGKHAQKIDALLESEEFSSFLALRLARWFKLRGSPEEPQAARAYSDWIVRSMESRRPYNEMVRELLTSTGDSHFVGAANFTRTADDARQHAELVSSVLMGTRIQCANCHNHPFAAWTQDDYHGLAAIFARFDRSRLVSLKKQGSVTNVRTGESALPRIPGVRNLEDTEPALDTFTKWMLDKDNSHFSKAIVNRLWDAMMGRGLVSGIDDFRETNPPSHPQLLHRLATDFVEQGYDLRHTLRIIATSNAYARCSNHPSQRNELAQWYGASTSKSLLPEVLLDAIDDVLESSGKDHGQTRERAIAWLDPTLASPDLDALGRCSRSEACQSEGQQRGLAAKLHAINGDLLNRRIADKGGRLQSSLREGMSPRQIIEDFYLRAMAKHPIEAQRSTWLNELNALPREEQVSWLEDFVWALLSSQEFSTNR